MIYKVSSNRYMKINGKVEIDGEYKFENLIPACASFNISNNINISKNITYGGTQIPFDTLVYGYGDTFYLSNNKIYSYRHAVIQVDYVVNSPGVEKDFYILLGTNGSYLYVGGSSNNNGLIGCTMSGSFQFEINADEYITLMLGSPEIYSNKTIYAGSKLSVSVVIYLD